MAGEAAPGSETSSTSSFFAGGPLRAGVGRVDITNPSPRTPVKDRLYARALVVDDGQTRVAIVTLDVTAIDARSVTQNMLPDVADDFMARLRAGVEAELGIPGGHVMVNASHTHPPGRMLCDDDEQVTRTLAAIRIAVRGMVPVRLGVGSAQERGLTHSRTIKLCTGRQGTIRHSHPCPPDDQALALGEVDAHLGVLRVDRLDGSPLAVVYNFASHLLWGGMQGEITANFPATASALIEETLGHDVMAMFIQGAAGDVVDATFKDFSRPREVASLGVTLGLSVLRVWRSIPTMLQGDESDIATPADRMPPRATSGDASGGVRVVSKRVDLPRRRDVPQRLAALMQEQDELLDALRGVTLNFESFLPLYLSRVVDADLYRAAGDAPRVLKQGRPFTAEQAAMDACNDRLIEKYLIALRAMERLSHVRDSILTLQKHQAINDASGQVSAEAHLQAIRIGPWTMLAAPLELLSPIGLALRARSADPHLFIAGFSNGYLHYGPPASDYDLDGYEVTECLLDRRWQAVFEQAANELLAQL